MRTQRMHAHNALDLHMCNISNVAARLIDARLADKLHVGCTQDCQFGSCALLPGSATTGFVSQVSQQGCQVGCNLAALGRLCQNGAAACVYKGRADQSGGQDGIVFCSA